MPSLENLHQQFIGEPFAVLGIDIQEERNTVLGSMRNHGISYTNLLDKSGKTSAEYGVRSTPMKFLIDRKGNLVGAAMGYREWDSEDVKALIRALMES